MTPSELSRRLAEQVETVVELLLPAGKRISGEWRCGNVAGDAGKSLGVRLTGANAGVWCDFATGDGGDLIDLWAAVRGLSITEAMRDAGAWAGVDSPPRIRSVEKTFSKPSQKLQTLQTGGAAYRYLTEERLLSGEICSRFRLQEGKTSVVFPFYGPDGDLVMAKYRSLTEKKIAPTGSGYRPALFGWQAVPPNTREITICEGEIDAMSLAEYGIPALSVPYGGGGGAKQQWIEYEYENLNRFDVIYLALDMDEEGRKATVEIADRLGRHRCRVVALPHKDANDCLIHSVSLHVMQQVFADAKTQDPPQLMNIGDVADAVISDMDRDIVGIKTPWDKMRTIRFRPCEVTIHAGINGHGKTEGVNQMAIDAVSQGYRVCVASLELTAKQLGRRIKDQVCAVKNPTPEYVRKAFDWLSSGFWIYEETGVSKTSAMLEVLTYARRRYGIDLFVIDNLTKLDIGLDDYNRQRDFVDQLCEFAKANECHVFLVCHMKKGESESTPGGKFDIKGSGAITDLADNVLTWWRNKPKEEALRKTDLSELKRLEWESAPDCILRCDKQRHGDDEPVTFLWWHQPARQFLASKNQRPVEYLQ